MHRPVLDIDLSQSEGRLLVAADIHGRFDSLDRALEEMRYDTRYDTVILIGDMVDRGHQSHRCLEWIDVPGRYCLKGNHESYIEAVCDGRISHVEHRQDGGEWFHLLDETRRNVYRRALTSLPLAARVVTPGNRRVGMIHADMEGNDFSSFCGYLRREDHRSEQIAMNGRNRFHAAREGRSVPLIADVDHVFFGHSPVADPMTVGNCSWIDTGLPHSEIATVLDVDRWISDMSPSTP